MVDELPEKAMNKMLKNKEFKESLDEKLINNINQLKGVEQKKRIN